ncbi:MAG: amidohydrolase [Deltaproteobacteria bacterium]|nr:amidohydrolase [Deltaproteobacteria bacterium]
MELPLRALDDEEGAAVAADLPPVVDAHVHLFPDRVFHALWRWFDVNAWPIRYRLHTEGVLAFLRARGVKRVVALHYAHKPGMAAGLNAYVAAVAREHPWVTGTATVFPGEHGAVKILEDAHALGLRGVKLHCHVQGFGPDLPAMEEIYAACERLDLPLVMHAGRQPYSPAYPVDPRETCAAWKVDRVLRDHPRLRLVVPHLGADEFNGYAELLEKHDNLWLDTTMVLADYFAIENPRRLVEARPDRVLYGTDFPNLPYAWDRELRRTAALALRPDDVEAVLGGNAARLFGNHGVAQD